MLLLANGFSRDIVSIWVKSIPVNFVMAYPLQVIFARPVAEYVFRKLLPVGTLIER